MSPNGDLELYMLELHTLELYMLELCMPRNKYYLILTSKPLC